MCLSVPMQITHIKGFEAQCAARGATRSVNLSLLQEHTVHVGDWVQIHLGYAIQTIDADSAEQSWALFDQLLADAPLAA